MTGGGIADPEHRGQDQQIAHCSAADASHDAEPKKSDDVHLLARGDERACDCKHSGRHQIDGELHVDEVPAVNPFPHVASTHTPAVLNRRIALTLSALAVTSETTLPLDHV